MKFYLQMGHGMQSICKDLSEAWNGATVILSPQNLYPTDRLATYAASLRKVKGGVLFDPQLYSPRKFHKNLEKHIYWSQDSATKIALGDCPALLSALADINAQIESDAFIVPSGIIDKIDERWGKVQGLIASRARKLANGRQILLTVALGKGALADDSQVEKIINFAGKWDIDGIYLVSEHPSYRYLVDNPLWISNLLTLVAGFKRKGKSVIVGYASHQLLCLALAKCDAIAAGNFLNTRWFKPDHFETTDDDERGRRATWYYCPQAFSEYKVAYLDVAKKLDQLSKISPPKNMKNDYSRMLFEGAMPSSTNYSERNSHLHYLNCLKIQSDMATRSTYNETKDAYLALLNTATALTSGLKNLKIKGQDRDYGEIVDVIEAAISVFDNEFNYVMSREWSIL